MKLFHRTVKNTGFRFSRDRHLKLFGESNLPPQRLSEVRREGEKDCMKKILNLAAHVHRVIGISPTRIIWEMVGWVTHGDPMCSWEKKSIPKLSELQISIPKFQLKMLTAVFFAKIQHSKWKKQTVPEPILLNCLVVEPTHLKKYARQNGFIFPNFRGENSKKHVKPPPRVWLYYPIIQGFKQEIRTPFLSWKPYTLCFFSCRLDENF